MDSSGHSDLQKKLMRVLSKAVQELELTWIPPEEPVRSKLDLGLVPFFPDVHEQLLKTWSALQSARVHSTTQAIFSHVDGAEAHGYVRSPPVEETVDATVRHQPSPRSHAGPLPTSLIKRMPLIASRRPRCTPWQCCRFFKRSSCRRRRAELSLWRLSRISPGQRLRWGLLLLLARSQMSGGKRGVPVRSAMVSRGARDVTLTIRRLLSRRPDGLKRGGERESGPAPKRQRFRCSNVCVLGVHSIKMHTFSQKELFPPHSVNTAPLAPPQSSARLPPTQVIATHPTTKQLCQFMSA